MSDVATSHTYPSTVALGPQRPAKRVLVVVTHPLGGIRTYLLYNLRSLSQSGYVFTFLAPQSESFEHFKNDVLELNGVEFIDVPDVNRKRSLRKAVRHALKTRRFALIHSQGLRAGTETALANLGRGIPHVLTLHDVIVSQNEIPGRFKLLKQFVAGQITKRIDVIIPVSLDCRDNHLNRFPCWRRGRTVIEVILNGVDVAHLETQAEIARMEMSLRQKLGIGDDKLLGGFFGRFMPQKGFLVLLDALKLLAQRGYQDTFRLVATDDPNGYGREYHRMVESNDSLREMVIFTDTVKEIGQVLSQVDMLVMPSLWEACPLLPMEAMMLGVPVVGSNAIGLREVLRNTPALTPEAGDVSALADAIEETLSPLAKQRAAEFMHQASQRFDSHGSSKRLLELYNKLSPVPC